MNANNILRGAVLVVVVCMTGAATAVNAQSAPAPKMNVGDKWVYNVKSGVGLTTTTYQETREVTAVSVNGGKVKVNATSADGTDFTRVEEYSTPGTLKSRAL